MAEFYQKPVAKGRWLYDETLEKPVYVIEQNYDFWYEMAESEGSLDEGELPSLNRDGLAYYVYFDGDLPLGRALETPIRVRGGFLTIEEAKAYAADLAPRPVEWE